MDPQTMYTGIAAQPFGFPVIVYLALAATAAGTAIFTSLFALSSHPDWDSVGSRGFLAAAAIILIGGVFLIFDLESPQNWTLILTSFNPQSWISWGARIMTLFGLVSFVAWVFHRPSRVTDRTVGHTIIAALTLLAGIAVAVYPAFVLQQFAARPLWNSSLILPLFLASALHAGLAVLALVGPGRYSQPDQTDQAGQAGSGPYGLGVWFWEVGLVLAQVVFVLAYLFDTGDAVSEAVAFLTRGNPAGYLWSGAIIGWLVPLALFTRSSQHEHTGLRIVRTVCILLGVVCLRAWLVIAGQDASMLVGM